MLSENWLENDDTKSFVSVVAAVAPTITPTAAITPLPSASEVILSIAWTMVIPTVILMLLFADRPQLDNESSNEDSVFAPIFCALILLIMMFSFMQFIVPSPGHSPRNMFLYAYLKDTDWFVIVYVLLLWALTSVPLFITIYKVLILIKIKGNKK